MIIAQKLLKPMHTMFRVYEIISTTMYTKSKTKEGRLKGYIEINPKGVAKFPWLIGLSIFFIVSLLVQIYCAIKYQNESNAGIIVATFLFYASLTTHFPNLLVHYFKRNEFCANFNAFVDFERRHNGKAYKLCN